MLINLTHEQVECVINEWEQPYIDGEAYGFGCSEFRLLSTFFLEQSRTKNTIKNTTERYSSIRQGCICDTLNVKAIFDNYKNLHNTEIDGVPVLSPLLIKPDMKIIVFPKDYFAVKEQLMSLGLVEYKNFIHHTFFVAFRNYFKFKRTVLNCITVSNTRRCTLKCKECSAFMPFYKNPEDFSIADLKGDLDALFAQIDYLRSLIIIGGEPLFHKDFEKYTAMLAEYSHKIGELVISTNGTCIPIDKSLENLRCFRHVRFNINDYQIGKAYEKVLKRTIEKVTNAGYSITLRDYPWVKLVRDERIDDENEVKAHYERCGIQCGTALQKGKLHFCQIAWFKYDLNEIIQPTTDYIDLTGDITSFDLIKASLGHTERGFTSRCAWCNGFDKQYALPVVKAEQM